MKKVIRGYVNHVQIRNSIIHDNVVDKINVTQVITQSPTHSPMRLGM